MPRKDIRNFFSCPILLAHAGCTDHFHLESAKVRQIGRSKYMFILQSLLLLFCQVTTLGSAEIKQNQATPASNEFFGPNQHASPQANWLTIHRIRVTKAVGFHMRGVKSTIDLDATIALTDGVFCAHSMDVRHGRRDLLYYSSIALSTCQHNAPMHFLFFLLEACGLLPVCSDRLLLHFPHKPIF